MPRNQRIAAQFIGTAYLQASKRSKSSAVAKKGPRKRVDKPKSKKEDVERTSARGGLTHWAKWEPVGALQASENDHQSYDLRVTQNCS